MPRLTQNEAEAMHEAGDSWKVETINAVRDVADSAKELDNRFAQIEAEADRLLHLK